MCANHASYYCWFYFSYILVGAPGQIQLYAHVCIYVFHEIYVEENNGKYRVLVLNVFNPKRKRKKSCLYELIRKHNTPKPTLKFEIISW